MVNLEGVVAIVTGASRGVGRGVAAALAAAGATVHVTGRGLTEGADGRIVRHRVDHANDAETEAVIRDVSDAEGRLVVELENGGHYERTEFLPHQVRIEPQTGDRSLIEVSGQGRSVRVGRYVRPELRAALAREIRMALRGA